MSAALVVICPHYSDGGNDCGNCAIALHGGRPSNYICLHVCPNGPRHPQPAINDRVSEHWGSRAWRRLHRRSLAFAGGVMAELAWFYQWCQDVAACGGCLIDWLEFVAEWPPDLRSAETYFRWTVAAHNTVTARRGADDLWSVEKALAKYSQP
jgi:hypothetical protein